MFVLSSVYLLLSCDVSCRITNGAASQTNTSHFRGRENT
jgi:hypothetical protein